MRQESGEGRALAVWGSKLALHKGVKGMEVTEIPGQSFENQQRRARLYWEYSGELVALGQTSAQRLGRQKELRSFPTAPIPREPSETDTPSTHLSIHNSLSNPRILMCFIKN